MTQRKRNVSVAAAVAGFVFAGLLSTQVAAHHSFAMYDQTIKKTMTGKLVRFILGASHSQFIFQFSSERSGQLATPCLRMRPQ